MESNLSWFRSHEHITNGYKGFERFYPILKRGIFLDTAPLFILICGHYDKLNNTKIIEKFSANTKHDPQYKLYDYSYLLAFLNSIDKSKVPLYITPHVFTEFIKHLTEIVKNPKQFNDILNTSFKSKSYLKDSLHESFCEGFLSEEDFLNKTLEVGDISIILCAKKGRKEKGAITILTDDCPFALVSCNKHNFITIYYSEIRTATFQLGKNKIPPDYLLE